MQKFLSRKWSIPATVLYDQPPTFFCKTSLQKKHELFERLGLQNYQQVGECDELMNGFGREGWGMFTERIVLGEAKNGERNGEEERRGKGEKEEHIVIENNQKILYRHRPNRPKLVVSSTSWTPDEDFSILLSAIQHLDSLPTTPHIIYIITGKGPLKDHYLSLIPSLNLKKSHILSLWLEAPDYPLILGSGDVGVSLHSSSSGIDLPMKVVDMYGCSLPVCALSFEALPELVKDGENGLVFENSQQLAEQLGGLLEEGGERELERLAEGIRVRSWDEEWGEKVEPLILAKLRGGGGRGVFWVVLFISFVLFLLFGWFFFG